LLPAAILFSGCVSYITPPAMPAQPVEVFLVQDGIHSGLIMPRPDGGYIEYGYGDWDWYALNYTSWYHVFDTVLWPTQGALGRRPYVARTPDELRAQCPGSELAALCVAGPDVDVLLRDLDARYEAGRATEVFNEVTRMHLVQVPESFWWGYNCADATAEWLRRLRCSVSRALIRTKLVVQAPGPSDNPIRAGGDLTAVTPQGAFGEQKLRVGR
jgi:hypothetical protein